MMICMLCLYFIPDDHHSGTREPFKALSTTHWRYLWRWTRLSLMSAPRSTRQMLLSKRDKPNLHIGLALLQPPSLWLCCSPFCVFLSQVVACGCLRYWLSWIFNSVLPVWETLSPATLFANLLWWCVWFSVFAGKSAGRSCEIMLGPRQPKVPTTIHWWAWNLKCLFTNRVYRGAEYLCKVNYMTCLWIFKQFLQTLKISLPKFWIIVQCTVNFMCRTSSLKSSCTCMRKSTVLHEIITPQAVFVHKHMYL